MLNTNSVTVHIRMIIEIKTRFKSEDLQEENN